MATNLSLERIAQLLNAERTWAEWVWGHDADGNVITFSGEEVEAALRSLARLQQEREADRWIPVSERLPEFGVYVLILGGSVLRLPHPARLCQSEDGPRFWYGMTQFFPEWWKPMIALPAPPDAVPETETGAPPEGRQ